MVFVCESSCFVRCYFRLERKRRKLRLIVRSRGSVGRRETFKIDQLVRGDGDRSIDSLRFILCSIWLRLEASPPFSRVLDKCGIYPRQGVILVL